MCILFNMYIYPVTKRRDYSVYFPSFEYRLSSTKSIFLYIEYILYIYRVYSYAIFEAGVLFILECNMYFSVCTERRKAIFQVEPACDLIVL